MKILIISDAWRPQINGVTRTLQSTLRELDRIGHETRIVCPDPARRATLRMPFYPEIVLEFFARRRLSRLIDDFAPDCIHIATEGPLGWAMRALCLRRGLSFTTAYHTNFPAYLAVRTPGWLSRPVAAIAYAVLRRFHAPATAVMVATASVERDLIAHGFRRLTRWSRGVDGDLFRLYGKDLPAYQNLPRPILLYVGRVAVEKNLRAFLNLRVPGSLVVIGDGPDLPTLRRAYPQAHFMGVIEGMALARHYAAADLFVFPSATDTFGLVLLEACAAGLRIAALPAPGPADIFADPGCRAFCVLDRDLPRAVSRALSLPDDPAAPRAFAASFSWESCTLAFIDHVQRT